ncbi:hypothetical protein J6O48_14265 [bacterium]|nr:hypothetical protein [bacterium]
MKQIIIEHDVLEEIKKEHLQYCLSKINKKKLKLSYDDCNNLFIENPFNDDFSVKNEYKKFKKKRFDFRQKYKHFRTPASKDQTWYAAKLIEKLNIRVCPYCGQQYFSTITKENGNVVAEASLDHFAAENEYYYLALNLYNLIPVCRSCNCTYKLADDRVIVNPYFEQLEDYIEFSLDNHSIIKYFSDDEDLKVNINIKKHIQRTQDHIDVLKLENRYNYYQNMIKTLIYKKEVMTQNYLDDLTEEINGKKISLEDLILKQDIFDENEPFMKFKLDIWKQL